MQLDVNIHRNIQNICFLEDFSFQQRRRPDQTEVNIFFTNLLISVRTQEADALVSLVV